MIKLVKKNNCTGCMACVNACPKNCINIIENKKGFLYPEIDRKECVNCGACVKACPRLEGKKPERLREVPKTFAIINKDEEILFKSASGGLFSAIAQTIIEMGGIVFGVKFNENFEAVYTSAETFEEIKLMRGSKYLQAKVGFTYRKIKNELIRGRKVLFCGLPCQVEGLYSYLQKDYDNLITADIVCGGASNPMAFRKWVEEKTLKNGKIKDINMRSKEYSWRTTGMTVTYESGEIENIPGGKALPFIGHTSQLYKRETCYHEDCRHMPRIGDITIGDFWHIGEKIPFDYDASKGVSLLMLNTNKGDEFVKSFEDKVIKVERDFYEAKQGNGPLRRKKTPRNKNTKKFYRLIKKHPYSYVMEKCKTKPEGKLKRRFKKLIKKLFNSK